MTGHYQGVIQALKSKWIVIVLALVAFFLVTRWHSAFGVGSRHHAIFIKETGRYIEVSTEEMTLLEQRGLHTERGLRVEEVEVILHRKLR